MGCSISSPTKRAARCCGSSPRRHKLRNRTHTQPAPSARRAGRIIHALEVWMSGRLIDARVAARALVVGLGIALCVATADEAAAAACSVQQGQLLIDQGRYKNAVHEFTCVINDQPTAVEGYRGRIEAEVLLGAYSDAVRDYQVVAAFVEPVHPDAAATIIGGYAARLAVSPQNIVALTGATFADWWFFDYPGAIRIASDLLAVRPNDVFGNLFRGSSRMLMGAQRARGAAD